MHQGAEIRWVEASYTAIHHVLTNPVYAGAYAYGKSRRETMLNASVMAKIWSDCSRNASETNSIKTWSLGLLQIG